MSIDYATTQTSTGKAVHSPRFKNIIAKMSKQDPSDQVRFLVECIRHTANGRPDFAAVAGELGIVSKAAAQKRYERMLKANNVGSKPAAKSSNDEEETPKAKRTAKATPTKRKAPAKNGRASKKAKVEDDSESDVKDKKPVKPATTAAAAKGKAKGNKVKKEEDEEEEKVETEDSASALSEPPEADDDTDVKSAKSEE
ncbi:hypothetical protein HJFPF1_06480 [Paramyrothecium foliicola]|nr:hypothetical protein HJFPF1_06480 [Paramyrothecium foliicola]